MGIIVLNGLEIIEKIHDETFDIVVMVQGDEPLISPEAISLTIKSFTDNAIDVANIMSPIASEEQFLDQNNVKVVCDSSNHALYFSRLAIPHNWTGTEDVVNFMQTGIIAFKRNMLIDFNNMQESHLEKLESVDMNRLLEAGIKIRMVTSDTVTLGVDTPEELDKARIMMMDDYFFKKYCLS